jgi:aminomuconate-semialdehyde/2-hydroxymuconate-6-semialdehyde dehydrogenase
MHADNPSAERTHYIAGRFVGSARRFVKTNPADGTLVAEVHEADRATVDAAVQAARAAMTGPWGRTSVPERVATLRAIADGIERRRDDFVAAEVADTGKPVALARALDIPRAAANFRAFADLIAGGMQDSSFLDTPDCRGALNYAYRKPLGVVGIIAPWSLPLLLLTWKVAPALACGNAVVVKPSEETPSTAMLLAEVIHATGVPPGVYNVVHGFGADSAGELITTHPEVDGIAFTGESATGAAIMKAVVPTLKPVSFELGGKNAGIVFADCDFDAAVAGTARSTFLDTGQVCLCTERLYVERPIFGRFVDALANAARRETLGWPLDPATTLGPLISRAHRDKVLSYYALARAEGAVTIAGGGIPAFGDRRDDGAYIEPTVWTGLPETARCVTEEVFGPVCHVAPFDDEDEAVARANAIRYGLAATVWTRDLSRGHRVAQRMATGVAWVNTWFMRDQRTPFGGMGRSGIGREGGRYSLDFYSEPTNVCVKL